MNENKKEDIPIEIPKEPPHLNCKKGQHPEWLRIQAGRQALYKISENYFKAICAAIFAMVLAKPELASTPSFTSSSGVTISLSIVIAAYVFIGVSGLFYIEKYKSFCEITNTKENIPESARIIFLLYTSLGYFIFWILFLKLLLV